MQKLFLFPDCHVPFEDGRAFDLALKALKEFKPHEVILLGDFVDFYSVSAHRKDPARGLSLLMECELAKERLQQITDAAGKQCKRKVYISGNHEWRLDRYLADRAPELYGMISIPEALELDDLGYKYIPYRGFHKVGQLYCTHDTGRSGRYCAQQSLSDVQHNIVVGHSHRLSYCVEGNAMGTPHVGCSLGWLGDKNACDYMHTIKANRDWALGFGLAYLEEDTGFVHLRPIPVIDYGCVVEGKLLRV